MSNLLKSKFFFGVMVLAIMFVGAFALTADAQTTTVVASGYTYSGVMKVGMSGPGISTLQAALNEVNMGTTVVVDGKFGPATLAAVKKFQMSKGLVADGVVGPATGAALTAATVAVITVPSNLPAGCTSNAGFSTTTGQSCAVPMTTLPAGCTSSAGYSSTTGAKCSTTTTTLPAGCTSTSGFSSTTGARCDGGSTSTNDGVLGSDEGDINDVNEVSSDDSDIEEGSTGEIFAFEAEIEGDVMVDRVDFYMEVVSSTTASEDADDYFSGAMLMVDGEEVAELDVEDWDQEDYDLVTNGGTDDDEYRLRFSGLDLVFADGEEPEFVLALMANNSIDSTDRAGEWRVALKNDSIRFVDGQDFTGNAGSAFEEDFGFDEEGEGEELNIRASSDDINDDATLLVEDDNESDWYDVFVFRLEAEENDIDLDNLVLVVTTTDGNYADIVDDVTIEIDGEEFNDFDVDITDPDAAELTFDIDGDFTISADDTVDVVVKMKFRKVDGNYDDVGVETVTVAVDSVEGEGASDVEDLTGVTGGIKTLSESAPAVSDIRWESSGGGAAAGSLDFFFTVEAEDGDVSVTDDDIDAVDTLTTTGSATIAPAVVTLVSGDASGTTDAYTVAEGEEATFRVRYSVGGSAGSAEVRLPSIVGQAVPDNKQLSPTIFVE